MTNDDLTGLFVVAYLYVASYLDPLRTIKDILQVAYSSKGTRDGVDKQLPTEREREERH